MALTTQIQWLLVSSILYLSLGEHQFYRQQPEDIAALVGSNVTIPCVIAPPHGDVQWTKDGLALGYDRQLPAFPSWSIIGDEDRGEFNFFIRSLKFEDEGVFACEVSPYQDAPALKQVGHLRVLAQPTHVQINDHSSTIKIRFDETIHQIHCRVDGARPAAHIKWINESDHEFPATSRTFSQDRLLSTISTLTLVPSLSLHGKRFTCHVRHETLTDAVTALRTSVEVEITSPPSVPRILGYPSNFRLMNGSHLTLSCQTHGGQPVARVSWYRSETRNRTVTLIDESFAVANQNGTVENNISLIISPADNHVTLSCHAINDYLSSLGQTLQSNVTLQVAFGPLFVYIEDKEMNATRLVEGTTRKFLCRTSSCNPPATVVWRLNGQLLSPDVPPMERAGEFGGTVVELVRTIGLDRSLRDYHGKILSCEARNLETGHVATDSTTLDITHDAVSIEMHGLTHDRILVAGELVVAECVLRGGHPLGQIRWYKGDTLLPSQDAMDTVEKYASSRVQFNATPSDHNLPLMCRGQIEPFPPHTASFTLNVTFLPEEIRIVESALLSNLSMGDDGPGEMECRTSRSNPQAKLLVTRQSNDGVTHTDIQYRTSSMYHDGMNSIKFMLPSIDLSLHGSRLTCEAVLDADVSPSSKNVTYTLYVNHKPYFHDLIRSVQVEENHSWNVTLEAIGHPMPITYIWYHPSGRQLMTESWGIGQLSLIRVQKDDRGVYRCVASNEIGNTTVNITVDVLYAPTITQTMGHSTTEPILPSATARLLCVIDANPLNMSSVRWFKDNQEILSGIEDTPWERRVHNNEASLVRNSVSRDDAGEYVCEIDNARATLPLVVQYAPEIQQNDPNRQKFAADADRFLTAEFHCHVSGIPPPTITWTKVSEPGEYATLYPSIHQDNQTLLSASKYRTVLKQQTNASFSPEHLVDVTLTVMNITRSDYGVYHCQAENALGIATMEILLTGLTRPDCPSDIRISNVSYSSAVIHWNPSFDGGAPQTFHLRYRRSTDTLYSYEHVPVDAQTFTLANLRADSEYHANLRSNNSYYLSEWTNEIVIHTSPYTSPYYSFNLSSERFPLTIIMVMALAGLLILLINIILITLFILKRRRAHVNSDNSSTTGTNETEANTVDIFQPIPSNFFFDPPLLSNLHAYPFDRYRKYGGVGDDEIKRPFVSSANLTRLMSNSHSIFSPSDNGPYAVVKDQHSPYDNLRLYNYPLSNIDRNLVTYRSFKESNGNTIVTHECMQAELV